MIDETMATYRLADCAVFRKTNEQFGGLSNMASGFPIVIDTVEIRTTEALYQACRFPMLPDVQREIIDQKSPMAAKMVGKPHRKHTRADWDAVRVALMSWCLRVKLVQNWTAFGVLLRLTGDKPIVEHSARDPFWGAKGEDIGPLRGQNVLGKLLMELRESVRSGEFTNTCVVEPLEIPDFLLYGEPIGPVAARYRPGSLPTAQPSRSRPSQMSFDFGEPPGNPDSDKGGSR